MSASLSRFYNNQSFEPGKIASAFRNVLSSFRVKELEISVTAGYRILDEGNESRSISLDELSSICELRDRPSFLSTGFGGYSDFHFLILMRDGDFLHLEVTAPTVDTASKLCNNFERELALTRAYPKIGEGDDTEKTEEIVAGIENYATDIQASLQKFQRDHGNHKTAFIMMQFGSTTGHIEIVKSIRDLLSHHNIKALRADDKEYHNNLLRNVLTYIYGCDIGIAVFEKIEDDTYNPNVAFEIGYMKALTKPVCLLVDQDMKLPTDLLGELYKPFAPQDPTNSIPRVLEKWLHDKDIINK